MADGDRVTVDELANVRGFIPTQRQDMVMEAYLAEAGVTFSRLVDTAMREFFERRGHVWPAKYGVRPSRRRVAQHSK